MTRAAAVIASLLLLAGCGGNGGSAGAVDEVEDAALAHVGERDATETTVDAEVDGDEATATVEFDGLRDDSVRAERRTLELAREGDGWRVLEDEAEYRCHQGRGQQEFAAELCR